MIPRTVLYQARLKRELLEGKFSQSCCRNAFLLGLSVSRKSNACLGIPSSIREQTLLDRMLGHSLPRNLRVENWPGTPTFDLGFRKLVWGRFTRALSDHVRGIGSLHCLKSYLKGIFVRAGYLQDPQSGYHLEIRLRGRNRMKLFRLVAKALRLQFRFFSQLGKAVAYMKGRRRIIRFLHAIEAFHQTMEFEDLVATRNMLELVNRQVNFETANINRSVSAAERQIDKLRRLLTEAEPGVLSDALIDSARARIRFPEDPIGKLGKRFHPPLSKSAMNHRLRRLMDLYRKIFPESQDELEP